MKTYTFKPIGTIQTPFESITNMPIQPAGAAGAKGKIILEKEYIPGLKGLEGFSHIMLLYCFHEVKEHVLQVKPFMDNKLQGIFATRAPKRPNAIGLSTVKLLSIKENILHVEEVDMLNNTPLLDIKPFFSNFDNRDNTTAGWLESKTHGDVKNTRSDQRFK